MAHRQDLVTLISEEIIKSTLKPVTQRSLQYLLKALSPVRPVMSSATHPSDPVWFWNVDGTWQEFLSQWYPCEFEDGEVSYRTTEMYMMYQKAKLFSDVQSAKKILGT